MKIYKVSKQGLKVQRILWAIPTFSLWLITIYTIIIVDVYLINSILFFPITFTLVLILNPLIPNATTIFVYSNKIVQEVVFGGKSSESLEAHQIEGIDVRQGFLMRKYNYGYVIISGPGGKKIKTPYLDSPEEVAEEIRKINPKLSKSNFTVAQSDGLNNDSTAGELEKLSQLLEKGLITREEFDSQKRKLLG
jgi:membrane protein YdbS with pleckstrin-like domain